MGNDLQTERTFYQQLGMRGHKLVCQIMLIVMATFAITGK
jgi:hypothetical protein